MEHGRAEDLQRQVDELVALVKAGHSEIEALSSRADDLVARADLAETRADKDGQRIDRLEELTREDREMIAELRADGELSRAHVEQLERALASSRTIGAAVGILMASRDLDQQAALEVLKEASSRSNTPMRQLAETIVAEAGRS